MTDHIDLIAALDRIAGPTKPIHVACRHGQRPDDCGQCEAEVARAEENAIFEDRYSERELGWMAEAEAAREWAGRGEDL